MVGAAAVPYLLRVFTFGLIAYVTDIPDNPNQIKLLLVDARHPPVATDGCPISKHEPLLVYAPEAGKCADWCRPERGVCRCPLERMLVRFEEDPMKSSSADHGDMEYVPALRRWFFLTRHIQPACLFEDKDKRVCPFVAAEAAITPQRVHSCEMALGMGHSQLPGNPPAPPSMGALSQSGRKFAFRSASQGEFELFRAQYVALKQVLARPLSQQEFAQFKADKFQFLKVSVVAFDDTEKPEEIKIFPKDCPQNVSWPKRSKKGASAAGFSAKCFDLVIANVPIHAGQHLLYGRCQGHGLDRDFELFEDLTRTQQDLEDREVPFDRGMPLKDGMGRDPLCNSILLENFNRWLRTDQATSECSGGRIKG